MAMAEGTTTKSSATKTAAKSAPLAELWAQGEAQDGPRLVSFHGPRKWCALTAVPGRERTAADFLKQMREWVYWPNYVVQVHAGRLCGARRAPRREVLRAVLPGYLFVARHVASRDPQQLVALAPGVTGFVRSHDSRAAWLGDADIEIIRSIEGGLNLPFDPKTAHRFRPGDAVRLTDDLLRLWPSGRVRRLADDGRIMVEVPLLGRIVPVTAFPHQIEPI